MRKSLWPLMLLLSAACATPATRIRKNQAAFDKCPPAVQEKIRNGEVAVGFTAEQALLALGEPDRRFTRKFASETLQVWAYSGFEFRPTLGVGNSFGVGNAAYSTGLSLEQAQTYPDEKTRLVFRDGVVISVETKEK